MIKRWEVFRRYLIKRILDPEKCVLIFLPDLRFQGYVNYLPRNCAKKNPSIISIRLKIELLLVTRTLWDHLFSKNYYVCGIGEIRLDYLVSQVKCHEFELAFSSTFKSFKISKFNSLHLILIHLSISFQYCNSSRGRKLDTNLVWKIQGPCKREGHQDGHWPWHQEFLEVY